MKKMEYVIGFGLGCIGTVVMVVLILNGTFPSMVDIFHKCLY